MRHPIVPPIASSSQYFPFIIYPIKANEGGTIIEYNVITKILQSNKPWILQLLELQSLLKRTNGSIAIDLNGKISTLY